MNLMIDVQPLFMTLITLDAWTLIVVILLMKFETRLTIIGEQNLDGRRTEKGSNLVRYLDVAMLWYYDKKLECVTRI